MIRGFFHSYRRMIAILAASSLLLALVGYASDQSIGLFEIAIAAVIGLVVSFHLLFGSSSAFFNIVFANAITLYLCFFTFFVESIFSTVARAWLPLGFFLPPFGFLLGAVRHRHAIKQIVTSGRMGADAEFVHSFLWLLPIFVIGFAVFIFHQRWDFSPHLLGYWFLGEMSLIAAVVYLASKDFALLLMDTGILFSDFFTSNARLLKPAFAFFTFYSLNIVVFAAIYRVIDYAAAAPNFTVLGMERDLTFVESLYFSLVTLSTLGYGDIIPLNNIIRFVVGVQTFLGTMLFFFGVHAILGHKKH